jgi:O-antigen ligase/polysaccharide polymerase Wzy-like membrane protein
VGRPRTIAAAALLAGPTLLGFMSGGFFEAPRLWAGLIVWVAVAVLAAAGHVQLPARGPALVAFLGLAGLAAWTAASIAWSPLRDPALADAERVWMYAGYLLLASALLRGAAARLVEPLLAAGTLVVGGYADATRLLPTLVPSEHSASAGARLDQPLTYWNALGAVMAVGIVLLLRIAADETRPRAMRTAALAGVPVNGLALYLTFSRGSLAAVTVGVITLVVLERSRRATAIAVAGLACAGTVAALASAFPAVDSLAGDPAKQRNEGLVVLAGLALACGLAALAEHAITRGAADRLRSPRAVAAAALALAALVAGGIFAVSRQPEAPSQTVPSSGAQLPTTRARLATLRSNRYDYWKVALHGFADKPFNGVGAHGFQQLWLQRRTIRESAQDAHSLYIETAAELGIVGIALLAAFLGGVIACLRRLLTRPAGRVLATGWAAASACWLVHAGLDWDWEMPAVSLLFLAIAGAAIGTAGKQLVDSDGRQHDQRGLGREAEAGYAVVEDSDGAHQQRERDQR